MDNSLIMKNSGRIDVIIGSMFSGKSTELIRRINRYKVLNKNICQKPECKTKLTTISTYKCSKCGIITCLEHRYTDAHNCGKADVPVKKSGVTRFSKILQPDFFKDKNK